MEQASPNQLGLRSHFPLPHFNVTLLVIALGLDQRSLLRGSSPSRRGSLGIPRASHASPRRRTYCSRHKQATGPPPRATRSLPRRRRGPSVKVRQHAHVTRSLAQALITSPQRHTGGYESTRQKCHIDSAEAPPPQPPLLNEVPEPSVVHGTNDHQFQKDRAILEVVQRELGDNTLVHAPGRAQGGQPGPAQFVAGDRSRCSC